jgi:hypothetical protein
LRSQRKQGKYALTEPWPTCLPRTFRFTTNLKYQQRISNISNKSAPTQKLGEKCDVNQFQAPHFGGDFPPPLFKKKHLVIETLIDLSFLCFMFSLLIGKISAV